MDKHEPLRGGCRMVDEEGSGLNSLKHRSRYEFAAEFVRGKRVLDVACGTGYGSLLLAEAGAQSVVAVDISSEAIAYAREHQRAGNLLFRQGNAERLDLDDRSIDVIVSFETIEHVADPLRCLDEARRVLADDGVYIVSTPNRRFASPWRPRRMPVNLFHVQEWVAEEFFPLLSSRFGSVERWSQVSILNPSRQVWETWCRQRLNRWLTQPAYRVLHGTRCEAMAKRLYRSVCGPDTDRFGNVPAGVSPAQLDRQREHFRVTPLKEADQCLVFVAVCSGVP